MWTASSRAPARSVATSATPRSRSARRKVAWRASRYRRAAPRNCSTFHAMHASTAASSRSSTRQCHRADLTFDPPQPAAGVGGDTRARGRGGAARPRTSRRTRRTAATATGCAAPRSVGRPSTATVSSATRGSERSGDRRGYRHRSPVDAGSALDRFPVVDERPARDRLPAVDPQELELVAFHRVARDLGCADRGST